MDYSKFDLLGDPIPPGFKGRGRPPHVPTDETRKVVSMLWAFGKSNSECAMALGITTPTFNRHYFKNKRQRAKRAEAMLRLQAKTLLELQKKVDAGSLSAIDKMLQRIDRYLQNELPDSDAIRDPQAEMRPLGKKERLNQAAQKVEGKFAPPKAPSLLN